MMKLSAWVSLFVLSFNGFTAFAQSNDDAPPLRPALPEIAPTVWEQHGALIITLSVLVVGLVGVLIWWLLQPKPVVPVAIEIQTRRELEALGREPESGRVLSKLSQCLRRYFAGAFGLSAGEMTTTEFSRELSANEKAGSELASAVVAFLRRADEQKFSPEAKLEDGAVQQAIKLFERGEQRRVELRQAVVVK